MIRAFENSDIPSLRRVWLRNAERLEFDVPPIDDAMIERALVSRIGFQAQDLMVCENREQEIVAWCHRCRVDGETIAMVAADSTCDRSDVESLLKSADCDWIGPGLVTPAGPVILPYTGLAPQGFGVGVSEVDRLVRQACLATGYQIKQPLAEWTIDSARYRMPMNRATLMFRRSLRLGFAPRLDPDCYRASNACHLETLVACGDEGFQLGTIRFFSSDPAMPVLPPTRSLIAIEEPLGDDEAIVDQPTSGQNPLGDINSFVLSSWIVEMAKHGVRSISTTLIENSPLVDTLAAIGFHPGQTGAAFGR